MFRYEDSARCSLLVGSGGFERAGFLAGGEVAGAEDGEVGGVALINVDEGRVGGADDVVPCFHFLGVGGPVGDKWTSGIDVDVELTGGRFVVGIGEAVGYAGAVDDVLNKLDTRILSRRKRGNDPRSEGERVGEGFGVCFEAI